MTSDLPFVSVIVPVLNDPGGIRTCVGALVDQTYPVGAFEIVVADNGSTVETRETIERLREAAGDRLRVVVEPRRSSYAARNRALAAARGALVAFTDADCRPAPTWLAHGVRALQAQGGGCVGGRIVVTYRQVPPNPCEYWDSAVRLNQRAYVERSGFAATANLFAEIAVFARVGPFRADLLSGGDREFGKRLGRAGERLSYAPDAVVEHPARATLRDLYRKTVRLARGHRTLHALGAMPSRRRCVRRFRLLRDIPSPRDWDGRLSLGGRAAVMVLHNLDAWLTSAICVAQCARVAPRSIPSDRTIGP